jgi:hypothetical protein
MRPPILQPFGKIPVLEDPALGITIFESRSILRCDCLRASQPAPEVASAAPGYSGLCSTPAGQHCRHPRCHHDPIAQRIAHVGLEFKCYQ